MFGASSHSTTRLRTRTNETKRFPCRAPPLHHSNQPPIPKRAGQCTRLVFGWVAWRQYVGPPDEAQDEGGTHGYSGKSHTKTLQPLMSKIKQQGVGSLESGVRSKGLIFVVCSDPVLCILQHFLGALHFPLTCVLACWLAGFCRDQLQVPTRRDTHQPDGKRTKPTGNAPTRRETHQPDGKSTCQNGDLLSQPVGLISHLRLISHL